MVAAGVYLVAKTMAIYVAAPAAAEVVAWIGLFTALFAASIALVQNDIKRVLAFSTLSQLGYMIMALGLTHFVAGSFHLMTHAFFKALLFLGAGSVIHAVHTNDIQQMGGLLGKMKTTAMTFLIACLAISGIPPLAGFWSKDEIIASTLGHPVFTIGALLVAFMTAFYMFRLFFLTFTGKPRDQEKYDHAHESPKSMTYPLIFLAVMSVCAGWVGIPGIKGFAWVIYGPGEHPHITSVHWLPMISSILIASSGILLAYLMYYKGKLSPDAMVQRFSFIHKVLYNKYYIDEFYNAVIIQPCYWMARNLFRFDAGIIDGLVNLQATITIRLSDAKMWFDVNIIDGIVNGLGIITDWFSAALRRIQTGRLAHYLLAIVFGLILIALLSASDLLNQSLIHFGIIDDLLGG